MSDSEIIMKTHPEKRKPKPEYMPPEERAVDSPLLKEKTPPIAPQLGIRIPLGK